MSPRVVRGLLAVTLLAAACSGTTDIDSYADAWAEAWSEADPYDIARFYDVDVVIPRPPHDDQLDNPAGFIWVGRDVLGAGDLVAWIPTHVEPRVRTVDSIAVNDEAAAIVVVIPEKGSATLHGVTIDRDQITAETILGWRDAHKPRGQPDERLAWVDELVASYVVTRPPGTTIRTIVTGDRSGPAIFTSPGSEPGIVAVVLENEGCSHIVGLEVESRAIVAETRLIAPECADNSADLWWQSVELPGRVQDREHETVTIGGRSIEVTAWTPEAEELLRWGFDQFGEAGLSPPTVRAVGFSPNPACASAAGVAVDNADGSGDFVLCTNAFQLCEPDRAQCSGFTTAAKLGLLHEMAHVWLLENLQDDQRSGFMELTGLETWQSGSVPWHERGAEHAAETLAWGLMDEDIGLVRIGDPTCEVATAGFFVLTGDRPLRACS